MPKKSQSSRKKKSTSIKKNSSSLHTTIHHPASENQSRIDKRKSLSLENNAEQVEFNCKSLESVPDTYDEGRDTGSHNDETFNVDVQETTIQLQSSDECSDLTQNNIGTLNKATSHTSKRRNGYDEVLNADEQGTTIQLQNTLQSNEERSDSTQSNIGALNEAASNTNKQRSGYDEVYDQNREQFIKGDWKNNCLIKLHYAQFKIGKSEYIRLYGLDNLYANSKHNFVARITLQPFYIRYGRFQIMRKEIEAKVVIIKIYDDDLRHKLESSRENFKSILILKQAVVTCSRVAQRDMFHLLLLINGISNLNRYGQENENIVLLSEVLKKRLISRQISSGASIVYEDEKNYNKRILYFPIVKEIEETFSWRDYISKCIKKSIESFKFALISALPIHDFIHSGPADINSLPDNQLFVCSLQDIQLFSDLEFSIRQNAKSSELVITKFHDFIQDYVNKLWKLFITKINQCLMDDIPVSPVYIRPIFLQLFKTFLELLNLVCGERNAEILNIVALNENVDLSIKENTEITNGKSENRLKFIVSLMNHFKPGDIKNSDFSYQFSFFKVNNTIMNRVTGFFANMFDTSLSDIPQKYVIWLYYIHNSFTDLFHQKESQLDDSKRSEMYSFFNSLMELFITTVRNSEVSLEKVRVLANSIIKFGTTISPYLLEQTAINENDFIILLQQAEYLKDFVTAHTQTVNDVTNLVDIYQVFWEERRTLFTELRKQYSLWPSAVDELTGKFNVFITYVFKLKIYNNKFLTLLRSYNEFTRLLRGTDFPWYVEKQNIFSESFVQLMDTNTESYLVRDIDKFIQTYLDNYKNLPQHFLFNLSINLINCVKEFLSNNEWEVAQKMDAASDLLLHMGRSLINFNKLYNAVDFQHFYSIFTEPFKRVTINSRDINDFKKRLGSLENYYKYTMEINVMSVENALDLCKQNIISNAFLNYAFNFDQLNLCYGLYLDKFNNYIDKYILQPNFDVHKFAEKIISKIKPLDISKWDSQYKFAKLSKLLAGLSAVWCALESRDVISQKQVMKPHCIQILCVMRLLGVDQARSGFDNHLAQVLTGQGKSLVLGLLAATLALSGNRVRIVCYNEYLANRDENDFQSFYETFNIEDQIEYGTFEDMANEVLNFDIKGTTYNLRDLIEKLVTGELSGIQVKEKETPVSKTVLLIDEVDVFFSPQFYGQVYRACNIMRSETLAEMQINIWNLTANNTNVSEIKENIQKFIDEKFMCSTDDIFVKIVRNSRIILNEHVQEMISYAINVRKSSPGDLDSRRFKLRNDGLISFILEDGKHSTGNIIRYKNVFMYFLLKKSNFEHMNFKNYGYLCINCGSVSYAMLPQGYRAIMGVTGTLKQLSNVEMRAVKSYQISRGSDMPTFFGSSRLRITNFTVTNTETQWTRTILDSILCVVEQGRAVIVFVEDEFIIETFRGTFSRHLSRYSVLTGNEDSAEVAACVEEAGVARRVTLATRRMGRGVDFQSNDSAVEAKGGVHVIQTFFSDDVKEETQIKGRTARKDNRGSYETILCRKHLAKAGYEDTSCSSYSKLNAARMRRAKESGTKLAQKIEESRNKHDATMEVLESFYNYNPNKRLDYFKKYPFVDN